MKHKNVSLSLGENRAGEQGQQRRNECRMEPYDHHLFLPRGLPRTKSEGEKTRPDCHLPPVSVVLYFMQGLLHLAVSSCKTKHISHTDTDADVLCNWDFSQRVLNIVEL